LLVDLIYLNDAGWIQTTVWIVSGARTGAGEVRYPILALERLLFSVPAINLGLRRTATKKKPDGKFRPAL